MYEDLDKFTEAAHEFRDVLQQLQIIIEARRKSRTPEDYYWNSVSTLEEDLIKDINDFDDELAKKFIGLMFQDFSLKQFEIVIKEENRTNSIKYTLYEDKCLYENELKDTKPRWLHLSRAARDIVVFMLLQQECRKKNRYFRHEAIKKVQFKPRLKYK